MGSSPLTYDRMWMPNLLSSPPLRRRDDKLLGFLAFWTTRDQFKAPEREAKCDYMGLVYLYKEIWDMVLYKVHHSISST
jgi:hypothetical protein